MKLNRSLVALPRSRPILRWWRSPKTYPAADHLEDRYETRLPAMIDAKLKGEGIDVSGPAEADRTNVVDMMAALKKFLGQVAPPKKGCFPVNRSGKTEASGHRLGSQKPGRKRA